jgi:hypothetical protein
MNVMIGLLSLRRALSKRSCGLIVASATAFGFDMCDVVGMEDV